MHKNPLMTEVHFAIHLLRAIVGRGDYREMGFLSLVDSVRMREAQIVLGKSIISCLDIAEVSKDMINCPNCHAENLEGSLRCKHCGMPLVKSLEAHQQSFNTQPSIVRNKISVRKRISKGMIIRVVAVAAILIIAVLAFVFLSPRGGNTPEQAMAAAMDAKDDDDFSRYTEATTLKFCPQDVVDSYNSDKWVEWNPSINEIGFIIHSVKIGNNIPATEKNAMMTYIDDFESAKGITVQDYCLIYAAETFVIDGSPISWNQNECCLKINGLWYFDVFLYH